MATSTDRWGLSVLGPGDSLQDDGFKFADADRRLIDRLLAYAVEHHRHTGTAGADHTPQVPLTLLLRTDTGSMPANVRYYYRFTVIDDLGNESAPSPIATVDTPTAITHPQAPSPVHIAGTGTLAPGRYSYAISAYRDATTLETKAVNSAVINVAGVNPANSVQLTLPDLPPGATGLNIYRKSPEGLHYLYVASVTAPVTGQLWLDDGSAEADCDRSLPSLNRTASQNAVEIIYPGATPTIESGWSWRVYRSTSPTTWSRSFLAEINPTGTTPVTPTAFVDTGAGTRVGAPPTQSQILNAPPKIDLTDAAEVDGILPPGRVTVPQIITFTVPGPVTTGTDVRQWVCDYDHAEIIAVRAYLATYSTPAATDIIVDVNAGATTIFTDPADRPRILVGTTIGDSATPTVTSLVSGDTLSLDVDQAGGGATPTDTDLTVAVLLHTRSGSETVSFTWDH